MTSKLTSEKTNSSKILRFNFLNGLTDDETNSDYIDFWGKKSWSDYDLVIVGLSMPRINNDSKDAHGIINLRYDASTELARQFVHIKQQIMEQLAANKKIVFVLSERVEYLLRRPGFEKYLTSVSAHEYIISNYWLLDNLGFSFSSHIGDIVLPYKVSDKDVSDFVIKLKLNYSAKILNSSDSFSPLFKDNNNNILGGVIMRDAKVPVLFLPNISSPTSFAEALFIIEKIRGLYLSISNDEQEQSLPVWVYSDDFKSINEVRLIGNIEEVNDKINDLIDQKNSLNNKVIEINKFKRLLYSNGKLLEEAVLRCLKLLGFAAKNFDNGENEFDAVFESEEGRLIGEVEGRDNKAIAIGKFDQLIRNITRDQKLRMESEDDEPPEKAKPVLFGNGFRCTEPNKRDSEFTKHCISHAKDNKAALIKTRDLYPICCYLYSNEDENYAKQCRQAIMNTAGEIVIFPNVPNR